MIDRLTPPAGVAPVIGVTAAGVPRAAGAEAAGVGALVVGCGGRAGGAVARGAAAGAGAAPTIGDAVVGRIEGIGRMGGGTGGAGIAGRAGALAAGAVGAVGAGLGGNGRGGAILGAGGTGEAARGGGGAGGREAGAAGRAGMGGIPALGAVAETAGRDDGAGGVAGRADAAGGASGAGVADRVVAAAGLAAELAGGRIAAPGIGGVSLGNDGRGAGVPVEGRPLRTKFVAGVCFASRGATGASGGEAIAAAGGVAIADAELGIVCRTGGWNDTGVGFAGRGGLGGATGAGVIDRGVRRGGASSNESGAASASDSSIARSVLSQLSVGEPPAPAPTVARRCTGSSWLTRMTAPHTEQRARTPPDGTLAGSTRNTDWHSTHETFNAPPKRWQAGPAGTACRPRDRLHDDRPRRPSRAGSSHNSSSPSPVRSPDPHA